MHNFRCEKCGEEQFFEEYIIRLKTSLKYYANGNEITHCRRPMKHIEPPGPYMAIPTNLEN